MEKLKFSLTQEEMIEMAGYYLSYHDYDSMTDFERYYYSRDLIKFWSTLPPNRLDRIILQLEVWGFTINKLEKQEL
jgi:hypothetical protein